MAEILDLFYFFIFIFLNVSPTHKVISCCSLTASRWRSVFNRAVPKVNTQLRRSTFQHAGRSTQGPPDTPSPRCAHWSLVRQRNLARSSPASLVCGARRTSSHARERSSPHASWRRRRFSSITWLTVCVDLTLIHNDGEMYRWPSRVEDGWMEWTGIMRRVKGNLISIFGWQFIFD